MTDAKVKPIVKFTLKKLNQDTGEWEPVVVDAPAEAREVVEEDGRRIHERG